MKKADIFVVISYKFCVFSCLIWASHPLIFETSITPLLRMVFLIWGVSINFWLWSINWKISQISSDGSVIFSLDRGWVVNLKPVFWLCSGNNSPISIQIIGYKNGGGTYRNWCRGYFYCTSGIAIKNVGGRRSWGRIFHKWKRWRHYLFKIKFHTKLGCCTCKEKFYYRKIV